MYYYIFREMNKCWVNNKVNNIFFIDIVKLGLLLLFWKFFIGFVCVVLVRVGFLFILFFFIKLIIIFVVKVLV